jgi:hypothetical protein
MAAASSAAAIVVCFVCCATPFAGDDPAATGTMEDGGADANAASVEDGGEAAVGRDATAPDGDGSDAAGCGTCDCDGDGYLRAGCGDAGDAGIDCDDNDPRRHPGQGALDDIPPPGQTPVGDWNCDGTVDKSYPPSIQCAAGVGCASLKGFLGDPGCGATGDYVACVPALAGLTCAPGTPTPMKQRCR